MGGPAKIKLSSCSLSNVLGNRFWQDFGAGMDAFLVPNWPSEATSKASVINYANEEGLEAFANPLPTKIFSFGPQCETEKGRASQADVTPYGVGGYIYIYIYIEVRCAILPSRSFFSWTPR